MIRTSFQPDAATRQPGMWLTGTVRATVWLLMLLGGGTTTFGQALRELEVGLVQGRRLTGMPIHWTAAEGVLLESTGRMHSFEMREVAAHRLLERPFAPQSLLDARRQLLTELGPGFDALLAGPYVIAAPVGQTERWRDRFMALLAGYKRYFDVRGWTLRQPDFPLCVIVFDNRSDFVRYAQLEGQSIPDIAIGSYFPRSNRCVLYHLPSTTTAATGTTAGVDWVETEATIIHEALHQLAFNTGVHERLFQNPLWFVEGLATMFEQPAVYDSRAGSQLSHRIDSHMVQRIMPLLANPPELAKYIELHIASDQLFQASPGEAYALAWGMTITLTERLPNRYGQYIRLQQTRRFGSYEAGQRIEDFRAAFAVSPIELAHMMQRLLNQTKPDHS